MMGYSFCIITDGKEPAKTLAEISSIRAMNPETFEIILVGDVAPIIKAADERMAFWMMYTGQFIYRDWASVAEAGRLGAMRNMACAVARFSTVVLADDDILFATGFLAGLESFAGDWDVMVPVIHNPDGSRFWDWKIHCDGMDKLLDYSVDCHPDLSLTGGIMVLQRWVADSVKWNGELGFYQAEDVDYTEKLKAAGARIRLNQRCLVTHNANYTQAGDVVVRI